jgi:multidrug transporter EmrE-like cation transporter
MKAISGYIYIAMTVVLTVYGQLIIKWRVNVAGPSSDDPAEKLAFLFRLIFTPWVMSGLAAAFVASVFWLAALTRFQLSYAYPFVASTFVLLVVGSSLFFGEQITMPKLIGVGFIVTGIIVASQG